MKRRAKLSKKRSKRSFKKSAGTHKKNMPRRAPMRGGIRM